MKGNPDSCGIQTLFESCLLLTELWPLRGRNYTVRKCGYHLGSLNLGRSVEIPRGESESGRLERIQMNSIWRNRYRHLRRTLRASSRSNCSPIPRVGGSKLQHREPQTRWTSGSQVVKSPASSELLAYPWRWLALVCSCYTAYVRTSLGMTPTIPYCQISLRAGDRVGVLETGSASGCSFTE